MIVLQHVGGAVPTAGPCFRTRAARLMLGRVDRLVGERGAIVNDLHFVTSDEEERALAESVQLVSRQHARVLFRGGAYELEDLGSANGTFLDGVRVATPQRLRKGQEIRLGGASGPRFLVDFVWEPPPGAADTSPPLSPWLLLVGAIALVMTLLIVVSILLTR